MQSALDLCEVVTGFHGYGKAASLSDMHCCCTERSVQNETLLARVCNYKKNKHICN
jgi:hypothetical protein